VKWQERYVVKCACERYAALPADRAWVFCLGCDWRQEISDHSFLHATLSDDMPHRCPRRRWWNAWRHRLITAHQELYTPGSFGRV
jgi:hypothetical protein